MNPHFKKEQACVAGLGLKGGCDPRRWPNGYCPVLVLGTLPLHLLPCLDVTVDFFKGKLLKNPRICLSPTFASGSPPGPC